MSEVFDADVLRMRWAADRLDGRADGVDEFTSCLGDVGRRLGMFFDVMSPIRLSGELASELRATTTVLRTRASMVEMADGSGVTEAMVLVLNSQLATLRETLDDDVGATGSDADRRAQLERIAFPDGVPTQPERVHLDPDAWTAGHVTATTLDLLPDDLVADYWDTLTDEQRMAAIVMSPGAVGDRFAAGRIDLADYEVFALQVHPIPDHGRQPVTPGTDFAGIAIPLPNASNPDDVAPDDEWRSFAGDSWLCDAIQLGSILPSRPDNEVEAYIDIIGTTHDAARTVSTATTPLEVFSPANWIGTFADISLCRLRVGSGAPISTNRVTLDTGEVVFEDSQSQNPYQVESGVPLSPDPRERDKQVWYAEHTLEDGNWAPYPADQYPVYGPQS